MAGAIAETDSAGGGEVISRLDHIECLVEIRADSFEIVSVVFYPGTVSVFAKDGKHSWQRELKLPVVETRRCPRRRKVP